MSKKLYMLLIFAMLLLCPSAVLASPILPSEEKLAEYDMQVEDIEKALNSIEAEVDEEFEDDVDGEPQILNEADINDFELLKLTKGFDKSHEPTFSDSKNIAGEGEEGIEVIVFIYQDLEDEVIVTFDSSQEIGASGIYNQTIYYENAGKNYVLICVKKDDDFYARQYVVNRKQKETKEKLESSIIELVDEKDNNTEEIIKSNEDNIENHLDLLKEKDYIIQTLFDDLSW